MALTDINSSSLMKAALRQGSPRLEAAIKAHPAVASSLISTGALLMLDALNDEGMFTFEQQVQISEMISQFGE